MNPYNLKYILKNTSKDFHFLLISSVATLDHTIQTVASVGKIKWRPQRKHHIGSTSLVVDSSVCVWDYRRPFVPFAAFEKHKSVFILSFLIFLKIFYDNENGFYVLFCGINFLLFYFKRDVATGIAWKNTPHVFLSTSKVSL